MTGSDDLQGKLEAAGLVAGAFLHLQHTTKVANNAHVLRLGQFLGRLKTTMDKLMGAKPIWATRNAALLLHSHQHTLFLLNITKDRARDRLISAKHRL